MSDVLPVRDALRDALRRERIVILTAPPGAGKSTLVPLELRRERWLADQGITMLEPRRLAARTLAARMASRVGEAVGGSVGYRIRRESRVSTATRIEVVTEGILTRALLAQPDLAGCGLLIFDEFHDRSIHADLGLALARRVQALFRPDLRILIMSATLDEATLSRALGGVPIVTSAGRSFPIEISHAPDDLNPERDSVPTVTAAIRRALKTTEGDILTFLPGTSEIIRSEGLLPQMMSEAARAIQARVMSLRAWGRTERFPDVSAAALLASLGEWLHADLLASRSRADLRRVDTSAALIAILDWNQQRALNTLAPPVIEAPTGSKIALQYFPDGWSPVLAVRLQEIFGWLDTPTVNEGRTRVTLHLLSPGRRPVQVTQDLRSFWTNTYPDVRRELRSRYPRHSWPDEPLTAAPIRGPKRRGT